MYLITEWIERYEVNEKGGPARNGRDLRAGPLSYIRWKVNGKKQGLGYRRLLQIAGPRAMEVLGIFGKLLEISADQKREHRGKILNEKHDEATLEDLQFILGIQQEQIENAVVVLKKLGWIDEISQEIPGNPGKSPEIQGIPEFSRALQNETDTDTQLNSTQPKQSGKNFPLSSDSVSVKTKSAFGLRLHDVLNFKTNSGDHTALANLSDKLDRMRPENPGVFDEVILIAENVKKSTSAKNPMAVFFSRVKSKYGFNGDGQ